MNDANDKLDNAVDQTAIVGHSNFTNALAGALASGRMHHAWLLTGPRGIGKAGRGALAHLHSGRLLAKVLEGIRDRNDLNTDDVDDLIVGCSSVHPFATGS